MRFDVSNLTGEEFKELCFQQTLKGRELAIKRYIDRLELISKARE